MTTAQAKPTGFSGDHGALTGLGDDDHLQYALLAGRALGQTLHGGTAATEELNLIGSSDADLGQLHFHSPTLIDFDLAATPIPVAFDYNTVSTVGSFSGGFIRSTGTITTSAAVFIWALLAELKTYRINATPGFAAFTLFNALPAIENEGNFNLVQALILNVGATHRRRTSGTSTTAGTSGMNFSPQTAASVSGALMTKTTGDTGLRIAPTWNTAAGSVIQFGTIRGVQFLQPAQAIFGSSAGTEQMTAYYGLDFPNMTFGGAAATYSVIRSTLNIGTNKRFLDHTGTAASRLRGNLLFDQDGVGVFFGASNDASFTWNASGFLQQTFLPTFDHLRWSGPAADRFLLSSNDNTANEFNFDFTKFSFGQAGAVGNQVGVFVAQARTVGVGGGWADFLLTQAGNLSIGAFAMSDVSAWVINAISLAAGTGSIAELATLKIGGMTTSNPGITVTERAALWVTGRLNLFGAVQYQPATPPALAAGDTDDYGQLLTATPSNNQRYWNRLQGNLAGTSKITGIDAGATQNGDSLELTNVSTFNVTLGHQDAGSLAANRIISPTGADYVLGADETVTVRYDGTNARWRILAGTGA